MAIGTLKGLDQGAIIASGDYNIFHQISLPDSLKGKFIKGGQIHAWLSNGTRGYDIRVAQVMAQIGSTGVETINVGDMLRNPFFYLPVPFEIGPGGNPFINLLISTFATAPGTTFTFNVNWWIYFSDDAKNIVPDILMPPYQS